MAPRRKPNILDLRIRHPFHPLHPDLLIGEPPPLPNSVVLQNVSPFCTSGFQKSHTLVIEGLPELNISLGVTSSARRNFDQNSVERLLTCFGLDSIIVFSFRMGVFNTNKPRPLKLVLQNSHQVGNLITSWKRRQYFHVSLLPMYLRLVNIRHCRGSGISSPPSKTVKESSPSAPLAAASSVPVNGHCDEEMDTDDVNLRQLYESNSSRPTSPSQAAPSGEPTPAPLSTSTPLPTDEQPPTSISVVPAAASLHPPRPHSVIDVEDGSLHNDSLFVVECPTHNHSGPSQLPFPASVTTRRRSPYRSGSPGRLSQSFSGPPPKTPKFHVE